MLINEYVYNGLPISSGGICQNSLETYSVINDPNIPSYDWNVFGGIIVQNWTDSIQVLWTNAGAGTKCRYEINLDALLTRIH